jgi:DNA repair protein SbcD/Mre11
MINFIHTADIHFGVENYGRIDPHTGIHTRVLDFQKSLNACIDTASAREVDFFLFAGDAYKTAAPSPTQQRLLFDCFLRLYRANIPVVMVVGNHDHPVSFGKAHALDLFAQLPVEGFHVIAQPQLLVLQTAHGPIQIVGIPWPSRTTLALNMQQLQARDIPKTISTHVAHLIADYAAKLDPTIPAVLAGHLAISTAVFSGSEKRAVYGDDPVLLPSQVALPAFDYVALGHFHRYQNLNHEGYPAVVYPGSIDRIDFGERNETKGFCHVTIPARGAATFEWIELNTRPFVQIDVALTAETSPADQTERVLAAVRSHNVTNAIVKIVYQVPAGVSDRVDVKAVEQACNAALYIVGIVPQHTVIKREQRSTIQQDMDIAAALTAYFTSKQIPAERIAKLTGLIAELATAPDESQPSAGLFPVQPIPQQSKMPTLDR